MRPLALTLLLTACSSVDEPREVREAPEPAERIRDAGRALDAGAKPASPTHDAAPVPIEAAAPRVDAAVDAGKPDAACAPNKELCEQDTDCCDFNPNNALYGWRCIAGYCDKVAF